MFAATARRFVLSFLTLFLFTTAAHAASYIVELNRDPGAVAAAKAKARGTPMSSDAIESYRATLSAAQDQFLAKLSASGIVATVGGYTLNNVRIPFRYTLVFNGINLIADPSAVAAIRAMPEVKAVHDDRVLHTSLDVSVPYIRAPQVYGAVKELTRFDNFREGFEGQGIYVAIIDTGVEWQHEMFGGDPTPPRLGIAPATANTNEKVVYFLPLTGEGMQDGVGHGTHVASTAAGYQGFAPGPDGLPLTADDIKMHGVAPQARIMAYKVCDDVVSDAGAVSGAVGGCLESSITMGIEDSMSPRTVTGFPKPVAHVLNMSLGGAGGPGSVTSVSSDNAAKLGATVVAAAGNDGPLEATSGAPCAGVLVTCVANSIDPAGAWSTDVLNPSAVNRLVPGAVKPASQFPVASGVRSPIQLIPMSGTPDPPNGGVAQYYVFVSGGETPNSYPANVAGRIAFVRTTLPSTFGQIANSAAAAGAIACVLRSDVANPTAVKATIPAAMMSLADFDYLVSLIGGTPTPANGTLSNSPIRLNPFYGKTMISGSSSRGPVQGFGQVKPDVTAPGTNILAAMPVASLLGVLAQGNYGSISGTSMASPHVAGAAALVKQSHLTWNGDQIRTALGNTSTNLRDEKGVAKADGATAESIIEQGSGLIDVYEAVNIKALMGVVGDGVSAPTILGSHSFGEVPSINAHGIVTRVATVTIQDVSGNAGVYNLSVVNNRNVIAGVSISVPSSVIVAANGAATFNVTASIDGSVITTGDPLQIQWYVRASRQDGAESLSMPFYLRATRTVPPPAVMNAIADDATPDQQNGVDRDGKFTLSWSYPAAAGSPCGYRLEEARPIEAGTLWFDDASELMLNAGNTKWTTSTWTTRPHSGTGSTGYGAVYIDNSTASLTSATDIALPPALVTLTFESSEDLELDFDYGYVDVTTDGGATWTTIATYTGAFSGQRLLNLSAFAGNNIRLRFRVVADSLVSTPVYQGWTIDDIRIQAGASFTPVATFAANVNSLAVGGKQDGTYAYRVTALFDNCATNPFAGAPSNIVQISVQNATAPPMAAFTGAPNPSDTNQTVAYDASASRDQDTVGGNPGIVEYRWSFGDGTAVTTTAPSTTHSFATAGTYRVALTVVDDDDESASSESLQTVRLPNANISGGGQTALNNGSKSNVSANVVQDATGPSGSITWNDASQKVKIESTRITRVDRSGGHATIFGECTVNKKTASTFVLELFDNGASGDSASMTSGSYSAAGTFRDGGVTVHE
jgi:subtilisin family serine protease